MSVNFGWGRQLARLPQYYGYCWAQTPLNPLSPNIQIQTLHTSLHTKTADISQRYKWLPRKMTFEERLQKFHTDDVSSPRSGKCFWLDEPNFKPIRSTTQTWVVMRHQCGISAVVPQRSFRGETSGRVVKCRLFSQAVYCLKELVERIW